MQFPQNALPPFDQAMLSAKRPSKIIDMPGFPGVRVALLVPTDEEYAEAQAEALHYLTEGGLKLDAFKLSISIEGKLYEAEYERQLLVRVLRNPVNTELSFASIASLRKGLNTQIRSMLMRQLVAWVEERSPETKLGDDPQKVIEFIDEIKKKGTKELVDWLMSCGFDSLVFIALSLINQLPTPTPPPSSDTSS